jgi:hypothetical protein
LAQRGREGEAAIQSELEKQRQVDSAARGLSRLFQNVTGRAESDRQAREAQLQESAKRQLQTLKTEVLAERAKFISGQLRDREALIERHRREDQQLSQTVTSRQAADKAAERTARQPETRTISHERDRGRGFDPS